MCIFEQIAYIHLPRRPCSKDIWRWVDKKAENPKWYPVIYPETIAIMESTKWKSHHLTFTLFQMQMMRNGAEWR